MDINVVIAIAVGLALAYLIFRDHKKDDSSNPPVPPVEPPAPPVPPVDPPVPPTDDPEVIIDRNGRKPGDEGYDPRIDRPKDEFSPVPPQGAYYGEGPFDPDALWIGPDGVHRP